MAVIALIVAIPLGLLAAIYLAEYASLRTRNIVKPVLETIAGIPTIVLGFFAINSLTPVVLKPLLGVGTFNALAGGLVVGLLVTPGHRVALRGRPVGRSSGSARGRVRLGATKWEVVRKVVVPRGAVGGHGVVHPGGSRAIGETMAVVLAAGTSPQLTIDPLESVQTMTAYIVQISLGDTPQTSIQFKSLFAVASVLFVMTFVLNVISNRVVAPFPEPVRMSATPSAVGHAGLSQPSRGASSAERSSSGSACWRSSSSCSPSSSCCTTSCARACHGSTWAS